MKTLESNLGTYIKSISSTIIRTKYDLIRILLETIKLFMYKNNLNIPDTEEKVYLIINKMNRFFFKLEDKFFSFTCPFSVEISEESIIFYDSEYGIYIDEIIISNILSIINEIEIPDMKLEDFLITIETSGDINIPEINHNTWIVFRKLLEEEHGYIRYDYDLKHSNGILHPLNHYDVFFSSNGTFKIGLEKEITIQNFFDLLDITTNCHFVK